MITALHSGRQTFSVWFSCAQSKYSHKSAVSSLPAFFRRKINIMYINNYEILALQEKKQVHKCLNHQKLYTPQATHLRHNFQEKGCGDSYLISCLIKNQHPMKDQQSCNILYTLTILAGKLEGQPKPIKYNITFRFRPQKHVHSRRFKFLVACERDFKHVFWLGGIFFSLSPLHQNCCLTRQNVLKHGYWSMTKINCQVSYHNLKQSNFISRPYTSTHKSNKMLPMYTNILTWIKLIYTKIN